MDSLTKITSLLVPDSELDDAIPVPIENLPNNVPQELPNDSFFPYDNIPNTFVSQPITTNLTSNIPQNPSSTPASYKGSLINTSTSIPSSIPQDIDIESVTHASTPISIPIEIPSGLPDITRNHSRNEDKDKRTIRPTGIKKPHLEFLLNNVISLWKENRMKIKLVEKKTMDMKKILDDLLNPNQMLIKIREKENENQMLQLLVLQYESTLDIVMKKFRAQTSISHDQLLASFNEFRLELELEKARVHLTNLFRK